MEDSTVEYCGGAEDFDRTFGRSVSVSQSASQSVSKLVGRSVSKLIGQSELSIVNTLDAADAVTADASTAAYTVFAPAFQCYDGLAVILA